jgi:putative transposase
MSDRGFKIRNQSAIHFITFATVGWIDVFTRQLYRDIVLNSLRYCQDKKALSLHAWCLMTNHIHLIASSKNNDLSGTLRDFKKFTGCELIKSILENKSESRKEWMLPIFMDSGLLNARNTNYQFWQQDNHPIELFSSKFIVQKINYIHENPVRAGIVVKPEHYLHSSATDYVQQKKCGLLHVDFL